MNTTQDNGKNDGKKVGGATADLKLRHEKFVERFLANGGNATEAARYAGYDQAPASLRAHASWLLKRPGIRAHIRARMLEGARVHSDEILGVLANQMRSNLMDAFDEDGQVDLEAIRALDLGHLVRKVTIVKKRVPPGGQRAADEPREEVQTVKVELQSNPEAVHHLARILRGNDTYTRNEDFDRWIFKLRNALIEFDRGLDESDLGLSQDEVFEKFAEAESPLCGIDLRLYKPQLTEGLDLGSPAPEPPARTTKAVEVARNS
jgi:hypothetical protein